MDRFRHGRSTRRTQQQQQQHQNGEPSFGKIFKNGIVKSESIVNASSKNNTSVNNSSVSVCPSTSGYATRSFLIKKVKSNNCK